MDEEIWKDVEGFEGRYMVSNHGRVKSLARCLERGRCFEERLMVIHIHTRGYSVVWLRKPGVHQKFFIHRLVAFHFLEKEDHHEQVNHKDKNRQNNHVLNLEWCTWEENYKHRDGVVPSDEPF